MVGLPLLAVSDGIWDQTGRAVAGAQESFRIVVLWRRARGEKDRSNSEATPSSKIEAMGEGQFVAESAACFK